MTVQKPGVRPAIPHFSSGPCAKRPGWSLQALTDAALGRSHRSKIGKAKLKRAIDLTREVLEVPADYRIAIVPASDTGAMEMAMWSLLGARPVTMLAWESFGEGWVNDVEKQLKLKDVTVLKAPYGEIPDLAKVNGENFPHDQRRQADRRPFRRRDAQHAVYALRRGPHPHPAMGESGGRRTRHAGPCRRQCQSHSGLGGAHPMDRAFAAEPGDAL